MKFYIIKLDELLYLIEERNIILEHHAMPESCNGHFYSDESIDLIIINESIVHDKKLYTAVLAEEVGHYFTCIGIHVSKKHMNYRARIELDRYEETAMRWACDFLIPTEMLISYIASNISCENDEIANQFDVTSELLNHKFRYMSYNKMYWTLDNHNILVLSGLPSVFVMKPSLF